MTTTTEQDYYKQDPMFQAVLGMGLERFVKAQDAIVNAHGETSFQSAVYEITKGQKKTHWMWWIFPQMAGLGFS